MDCSFCICTKIWWLALHTLHQSCIYKLIITHNCIICVCVQENVVRIVFKLQGPGTLGSGQFSNQNYARFRLINDEELCSTDTFIMMQKKIEEINVCSVPSLNDWCHQLRWKRIKALFRWSLFPALFASQTLAIFLIDFCGKFWE